MKWGRLEGEWQNDWAIEGTLTFSDNSYAKERLKGAKYEGQFEEGAMFHGQGKFTWSDGSYYEGDFKDNTLNGQGRYHSREGDVTGQWVDGCTLLTRKLGKQEKLCPFGPAGP
jgi:hypothetical protein